MATSTTVKLNDDIETKIKIVMAEQKITNIPEAVNFVLKNYFRIGKKKTENLLTPDEVREVFNKCLENTKRV